MGRIIRNNSGGSKLPLLGKVKIGDKKMGKNGKEYPVTLDYFRPTGDYAQDFTDKFGKEPKKITIVFISDNYDDVCDERYEIRDNAGKLVASGDGENWKLWNAQKGIYDYGHQESLAEIQKRLKLEAKATLTLRFIIPKLKETLGIWQFETKGAKSSIDQIRDTFDKIQEMAGTVISLPFELVVEKVKSQNPGQTKTFPVVKLVPNVGQSQLQEISAYLATQRENFKPLSDKKYQMLISGESNVQALPPSQDGETSTYEEASTSEPSEVQTSTGNDPNEIKSEHDRFLDKVKSIDHIGDLDQLRYDEIVLKQDELTREERVKLWIPIAERGAELGYQFDKDKKGWIELNN